MTSIISKAPNISSTRGNIVVPSGTLLPSMLRSREK